MSVNQCAYLYYGRRSLIRDSRSRWGSLRCLVVLARVFKFNNARVAMRDGEDKLPTYTVKPQQRQVRPFCGLRVIVAGALSLAALQITIPPSVCWTVHPTRREHVQVPLHAAAWLEKCHSLTVKPGPPSDFNTRIRSDRFVPGTKATAGKFAFVAPLTVEGARLLLFVRCHTWC